MTTDKEKGKRALRSKGAVPKSSKLSGVNKTFLLATLPYSEENYSSGKLLLSPESVGYVRHEAHISSCHEDGDLPYR